MAEVVFIFPEIRVPRNKLGGLSPAPLNRFFDKPESPKSLKSLNIQTTG